MVETYLSDNLSEKNTFVKKVYMHKRIQNQHELFKFSGDTNMFCSLMEKLFIAKSLKSEFVLKWEKLKAITSPCLKKE